MKEIKDVCKYTEIGYVKDRYPRFEYKSECGLQAVQMDHKGWNGTEYQIFDYNGKKGKCSKCGKEISIIK